MTVPPQGSVSYVVSRQEFVNLTNPCTDTDAKMFSLENMLQTFALDEFQ